MKIISFRSVEPSAWDRLVDRSDEAWLTHRAGWIAIEQRFVVQKNLSFALIENDEIVGVHPLYFSDSGVAYGERLLHSGIHRQTGLALSNDLDPIAIKIARSLAMEHVLNIGEQVGADRIQLNTHNLAPANRSKNRQEIPFWVMDYGFHLGLRFLDGGFAPCPGMTTCCADQIVDLTVSEDVLFERLDPACRRAVRKATKAGLIFEASNDPMALEKYFALARRSAQRTGEALPSVEYYRTIVDTFSPAGEATIGFALSNGAPVAAIFAISAKGATNFLAGVSEPEALSLRCNDFAHWQFMLWAKHQGFEDYRLGPWFPEVPRSWPIARVSLFKTKFGGRATTIIQGSLFRNPALYVNQAANAKHRNLEIGCGRDSVSQGIEI